MNRTSLIPMLAAQLLSVVPQVKGEYIYTFSTNPLTEGPYDLSITITATDAAVATGNLSTASSGVTVSLQFVGIAPFFDLPPLESLGISGMTVDPSTGGLTIDAPYVEGVFGGYSASEAVWTFPDSLPGTGPVFQATATIRAIVSYSNVTSGDVEEQGTWSVSYVPSIAAPEPASLTLLGTGAAALLAFGWRRKRRAAC